MPTYTIVEMDRTNGIATWDTSFATLEDAVSVFEDTKFDEANGDKDLYKIALDIRQNEWEQIDRQRTKLTHAEGEVWITETTGEFS